MRLSGKAFLTRIIHKTKTLRENLFAGEPPVAYKLSVGRFNIKWALEAKNHMVLGPAQFSSNSFLKT
jgi:hypothetical protein